MNMEDCPVHKVEKNPPYPFTCRCKDDYTDWNWKNLAQAEYHGWAAYGEYHAWVRENHKAHELYVKMLWDYQETLLRLYRKWLLRDIAKKIREEEEHHMEYMPSDQIKELLETFATVEYYEGIEDREVED